MDTNLLGTGIYVILNEELKIAYVGETTRSFLIRFIEHLAFEKTWVHKEKVNLLLHNKTEFKIIKKFEYRGSAFIYIASEKYYSEEYEKLGYKVINQYSIKVPSIRNQKRSKKKEIITNEENLMAYRRCLNYIAVALAKKNNLHPRDIYIWCYNDINKKFNTNINIREGEKTIEKINLKELEYIVLKLFNKYKDYILESKRLFFKSLTDKEIEEFFYKEKKEKQETRWCILRILDKTTNKSHIIRQRLTSVFTVETLIQATIDDKVCENTYKNLGVKKIRKYINKKGVNNFEFIPFLTTEGNKDKLYLEVCLSAKKGGFILNTPKILGIEENIN